MLHRVLRHLLQLERQVRPPRRLRQRLRRHLRPICGALLHQRLGLHLRAEPSLNQARWSLPLVQQPEADHPAHRDRP
jgi:hypothetical protein